MLEMVSETWYDGSELVCPHSPAVIKHFSSITLELRHCAVFDWTSSFKFFHLFHCIYDVCVFCSTLNGIRKVNNERC